MITLAKIQVCDLCKADGKLTECSTYMRVRNKPTWRLDYCSGCKKKIEKLSMIEYVRLVYTKKFKWKSISDEEIKKLLQT